MLLKLLQYIDRNRFSPYVISLTSMGEIGPRIQALGIPVEALNMKPGLPNPLAFYRLVCWLRVLKPDVVHTFMYHSDLLGGLAARLAGVKALAWCIRHTDLSAAANKRSTLVVIRLCSWLSHWLPRKILLVSDVSRQVHEAVGFSSKKMVVIPNGFDLKRFLPLFGARETFRHEIGLNPATPLVGVIGRYHPQKNQLGFVDAMAALHSKQQDVHFVLAGHGVDSSNATLMAAIQTAGVAKVCHLLGPRTDMPQLMASLDVLALPSVGEAFPNVLGEAMACGVPCAVTDVGDCAMIVGNTGRVVSAGNMSGLAKAINNLLTLPADERAALGAAARERVAALFEISAVVKQYEAFYESLVADGT